MLPVPLASTLPQQPVRRAALALLALLAQPTVWADTPVVPVVAVQAQAVPTGFELDGVVEPVKQSTVAAQTGGRIASLQVKAGDRVRAGQLLATIDDRETQTGLERSQAQVSQTEAELRNARSQAERLRNLRQQGFVSQAALDTAETQLQAAQAARRQADAGARQSTLAQGYTQVTAPYDGWVQQTLSQAGDLAVPGKPILSLYAPLPLRATVQVPASRGAVAQAASRVEVLGPGGNWITPVRREVVPVADPVAQTVEWRLELPAAAAQPGQAALVPGQQIRVRFVGGQVQKVVIPPQAVLRRGELTAVYVAGAQGFVLKAVRLGADHGSAGIEVLAGLAAKDQVALDPVRAGLLGAVPGQPTPAAPARSPASR